MDTETKYWLVAFLGGGSWMTYGELDMLVNRDKLKVSDNIFLSYVKRAVEYGLLKQNIKYHNLKNRYVRFSITKKGGDALEAYKKMRYLGTKEEYKLKDDYQKVQLEVPVSRNTSGYRDPSRIAKYTTHRDIRNV